VKWGRGSPKVEGREQVPCGRVFAGKVLGDRLEPKRKKKKQRVRGDQVVASVFFVRYLIVYFSFFFLPGSHEEIGQTTDFVQLEVKK
jgi:hypothetical protein